MATGGIFTLITNDGKQDRMLMATAFLSARLASIRATRASNPQTANDPTPTLLDIERTHVLFTNAHFKPFAAIGFEYNKVKPTSGTTSLGQQVQFSIPQFGDFFHDMAVHASLSAPTVTVTAAEDQNKPAVRWTTYPGERLLKTVKFEVNGNPLDEYSSLAYNYHREFQVSPNKIVGWNRLVGQENPLQGYVDQPNWAYNTQSAQSFRYGLQVFNGAQTPKNNADVSGLELYVPLLFWFNRDVRLSIPSVAIPFGQRFLSMTLAAGSELVDLVPRGDGTWSSPNGSVSSPTVNLELYINNIFVNPDVHNIYIQRIGFSLIRVHRQQQATLSQTTTEVLMQQLKWPIEFLFVGVKMTEYWAPTTSVSLRQNLQNWHRFTKVTDTTYNSGGQLSYKKYRPGTAASTVAIVAATGGVTGVNTDFVDSVAVGDTLVVNGLQLSVTTVTSVTAITVNAGLTGPQLDVDIAATTGYYFLKPQGLKVSAQVPSRTVTELSVRAHGINIYNAFPAEFYNSYLPYHYGGPNINTPSDIGAMMVPFCLYPGTYQPSGHINVSRAREFYLNCVCDPAVINNSTTGELLVLASAINFLLISDGSAILRYST
jgi:hypothetical protein